MSFFIRKRSNQRGLTLPSKLTDKVQSRSDGGQSKRKRKGGENEEYKSKRNHLDEEITSEEEEEEEEQQLTDDEDEVEETEQEARVRLAKDTLAELKKRVNGDQINDALKEAELVERGVVLQKICGDDWGSKELATIVLAKGGKMLKSPMTCIGVEWKDQLVVYVSFKSGVVGRLEGSNKTATKLSDAPVHSIVLTPRCLAACTPSAIHLLDKQTLEVTHRFSSSRNATSLACHHDTLYSTHRDRTVKLWNLQEKAYVESLFGHQDTPTCVDALSGTTQQRCVTGGGFDRTLRLWKVEEETQLVYNWDNDIIECVKVLGSQFFVAGACSGDIGLFSFGRKKPLHVIQRAHGSSGGGVGRWISALGGLGDFVVSGSDDGVIKIWRVDGRKLVWVRDVGVELGVVVGLHVVVVGEGSVRVVAGVSYEGRSGRWAGNVGKRGSRVFLIQ